MRLKLWRRDLRSKIIAWSFVPTAIILAAVALTGFYAYEQVTQNLTIGSSRELTRLSAGQLSVVIDDFGRTLSGVGRNVDIFGGSPNARQATLEAVSNRLAIFDAGVLILDNYGKVVAAQPNRPDLLGQDWSTRAIFQQMVRTPGTVYSDIVNNGPGDTPAIAIAVPLTGNQGELVGMLVGMFRVDGSSVSSFYGSIVQLRIRPGATTYLVDHSGRVIYHTYTNRIGADFHALPVVQQVSGGASGAFRTTNLGGQDILASFAPVPGTPWGLVVEQDWGALLASGESYGPYLLSLLLLGLLVPAVVVTFGVRKITEPIQKMILATKQVASGDFGQQIVVQTGDELEALSQQFNQMSVKLSESYAAIKAREERLDLVIQGTNDGIWDWDIRTGDTYFSPRWKAMLGYQDHEVVNRFEEWRHLMHPDDVDRVMGQLKAYLEGHDQVYQLEHRLQHKDGSYRWILARGMALRDASGQAYRMAGSHTDITERRQADEQIRRQNEYLAALHDTTLGVVSRLEITELLETLVERAVNLVGALYGWAYLVTPEKDAIEVKVGTGLFRKYIGLRLKQSEGLAGTIWQMGQPLVVNDYHHWSGRSSHFENDIVGPSLGVPLKSGAEVVGIVGLTRAPADVPFDQEETDLMSRFAQLASIALDNARLHTSLQGELTERVRAEKALELANQTLERRVEERTRELATLNAEAERRRQVAEGMSEVLTVLNSRQSLDETLDYIVSQSCRLMVSDAAAILRFHTNERLLKMQSTCGLDAEYFAGIQLPVDESLAGRAIKERRPVAERDTLVVLHRNGASPAFLEQDLMQRLIRQYPAMLAVPLVVQDEDYGVIVLYYQAARDFSDEDTRLAMSVAHQAALAIESGRLREQAEEAAAIAERTRLARELHDSVTQSLYSMTLYAEAAARLLVVGNTKEAAEHLRELRDTAQEALREMRLLIFELRPLALERTGLAAAIRARLDAVEVRGGMQVEFKTEGTERLSTEVQKELYHIAQEALNNVLKHATAQQVQVRLEFRDDKTWLEVCDDGIGFSWEESRRSGGLGLRGMKERAQRIGGKLWVESVQGKGTTVTIEVPMGGKE